MAQLAMKSSLVRPAVSGVNSRLSSASVSPQFLFQTRLFSSPVVKQHAVGAVDYEEDDDEGASYTLTSWENRRVLALKELQTKFDAEYAKYLKEVALIEAKYMKAYDPIFEERRQVISGSKSVDKYDIEDDKEPDNGLSNFWLQSFISHPKINMEIAERDQEVLSFLDDMRCEILTGEERGFKIYFLFRKNPFFSNNVLTKEFIVEADALPVPVKFTGCSIKWVPEKDVTMERRKPKARAPGGPELVPCESFFNLFETREMPKDPQTLSEKELAELQEAMSLEFDIGCAIKGDILPKAIDWFTGEADSGDAYGGANYEEFGGNDED